MTQAAWGGSGRFGLVINKAEASQGAPPRLGAAATKKTLNEHSITFRLGSTGGSLSCARREVKAKTGEPPINVRATRPNPTGGEEVSQASDTFFLYEGWEQPADIPSHRPPTPNPQEQLHPRGLWSIEVVLVVVRNNISSPPGPSWRHPQATPKPTFTTDPHNALPPAITLLKITSTAEIEKTESRGRYTAVKKRKEQEKSDEALFSFSSYRKNYTSSLYPIASDAISPSQRRPHTTCLGRPLTGMPRKRTPPPR
ncbi:hypothetical protein O3P69_003054 [Scylla paramamosain]|uniref:Uncharacterized protein n=1 Tax=Scylla paramamosain TaxID=85552 RepID=A0AAW0UIX0_SCYPA